MDVTVSSGVTSSGLSISSGAILTINSGGTAQDTTVVAGGYEHVSGTPSGSFVGSGGQEIVYAGGTETYGSVASGGDFYVYQTGSRSAFQ